MTTLTLPVASQLASLPLRCLETEFPNKLDHVMNDDLDVRSPRTLHPAFYGCFDWHSSVHGHWMLLRLLKLYPDLPQAEQIRTLLEKHFSAEAINAEIAYLEQPNRKAFERTYGWAWLLKLAEELHTWPDPQGQRWAEAIEPLAKAIVARYTDFLPRQHYPIRTGVHPNTAFGLSFALDYARTMRLKEFEALLAERSRSYFFSDTDYPAQWEPGGEDFFSPALMEADLMRRVLPADEFGSWFSRFLPGLERGKTASLLRPVLVTDRSDPKLVHLDGLNLSRAWCMHQIARALPPNYQSFRMVLMEAAEAHLKTTLPAIASGHYEGEHWLASFAVFALSEAVAPADCH